MVGPASECVFKGVADVAYRFIVFKFDTLLPSVRKKTLSFGYSFVFVLRSVDPVRRRLVGRDGDGAYERA